MASTFFAEGQQTCYAALQVEVVVVSRHNGPATNTAKPPSVRRHVDRKILRLSSSIGAIAALFTGFIYIASAYPLVQRWRENNLRALDEIACADETCDTRRFTTDWHFGAQQE